MGGIWLFSVSKIIIERIFGIALLLISLKIIFVK
jgi:hypothetical protein